MIGNKKYANCFKQNITLYPGENQKNKIVLFKNTVFILEKENG